MSSTRWWPVLCLACVLGVSRTHALGQSPAAVSDSAGQIFSHEFLDLSDPCAVRDATGGAMLTFGGFDANDRLVWVKGFESLDAWLAYAPSDPNLPADRTEQVGWALSGGKEDIFWQLQAILYLCPEYRRIIEAIESRSLIYDANRRIWLAPGIELTNRENRFDLVTATVLWNPRVSWAWGGPLLWDRFPPLAALAHELVHAYQRIVEDRPTYTSPLQAPAMKYENLVRQAFYRRVPDNGAVRPRPGNAGFYLDNEFAYLFDDLEWADWSPSYVPLLDVFEEQ